MGHGQKPHSIEKDNEEEGREDGGSERMSTHLASWKRICACPQASGSTGEEERRGEIALCLQCSEGLGGTRDH